VLPRSTLGSSEQMAPLRLRQRRCVVAKCVTGFAAVSLTASLLPTPAFFQSAPPNSRAVPTESRNIFVSSGSRAPAEFADASQQPSAGSIGRFFAAGMLSVCILVSTVVAPQKAYAAEPNEDKPKTAPWMKDIINEALFKAQTKAAQKKKELAEKEKAEEQMRKLNDEREAQLEVELKATRQREAAREAAMEQLNKKAEQSRAAAAAAAAAATAERETTSTSKVVEAARQLREASNAAKAAKAGGDGNTDEEMPKAQAAFKAFFSKMQKSDTVKVEKIVREEKAIKKESAVRAIVLKQLDASRLAAKKAAEEAEDIAQRIEKLAREAREAAGAAKFAEQALSVEK